GRRNVLGLSCATVPELVLTSGLAAAADEICRAAIERHHLVGLGIAVVEDGVPVLVTGYGKADLSTGEPVTADTVFRIGSITKTFTAIVVLQLVEEGLVSLDSPVPF